MNLKKILDDHFLLLEWFIFSNLSFLTFDVYLAHLASLFHHPGEYVPVIFSLISSLLLLYILVFKSDRLKEGAVKNIGYAIGWGSVITGVLGMVFHLTSNFFSEVTIKSLVYTAPFVAPLSYTGLGLLIILNRKVQQATKEWAYWVIFFALGGFVGNFILALADHAQNGFFNVLEWVPVFSSAAAVGVLLTIFITQPKKPFFKFCYYVMGLQILVGTAGFLLHVQVNLEGLSPSFFDNFIYGAPIFAPLLLPNLAILAFIGLIDLEKKISS